MPAQPPSYPILGNIAARCPPQVGTMHACQCGHLQLLTDNDLAMSLLKQIQECREADPRWQGLQYLNCDLATSAHLNFVSKRSLPEHLPVYGAISELVLSGSSRWPIHYRTLRRGTWRRKTLFTMAASRSSWAMGHHQHRFGKSASLSCNCTICVKV